jgi:hypothetical protein
MSITLDVSERETFIEGAVMSTRKRLLLAPALLLVLSSWQTGRAQPNRSVYTSLDAKQCRTLKNDTSEAGDYLGRCKGVSGYSLLLAEGDLRQNLTVVTPSGSKHSLELWTVISGGFSSLGSNAEWRVIKHGSKLVPVALIVRFNASEDPGNSSKVSSYLAVTKISKSEICVTHKIGPGPQANEDARRAADAAADKPCLKAR